MNMTGFEEWLKTRQTIETPIEIDLDQFEDKIIETESTIENEKEVLKLDSSNELLIAAQVNEAIQSALDRIEYNLEMLRSLTRMPRNPTFLRAIAKRVKLGRKLHTLVASQVKLKLTEPMLRKRIKVVDGRIVQTAEAEVVGKQVNK